VIKPAISLACIALQILLGTHCVRYKSINRGKEMSLVLQVAGDFMWRLRFDDFVIAGEENRKSIRPDLPHSFVLYIFFPYQPL
jgi:hypothetical protein